MQVLILKKRKEFVRVAKELKVVTSSLILQAAQSLSRTGKRLDDNTCYLGFTATKKLGKAYVRNRTKRRLRAAAQKLFAQYGRAYTDYVIIGRYCTADVDFVKLQSDMKLALKNINRLLNKSNEKSDETADDLAD